MTLLSSCERTRSPGGTSSPGLEEARKGHVTRLLKQESEGTPPQAPPEGVFQLVRYASPAGQLAAYVSPDPGDGKKHPLVIWFTGGFSNSIGETSWTDDAPEDNDQSAGAYRKAGIPMMYPSLRGGNDNPGHKEGFYGEVDDALAAAANAAKLPWVDASRIYLGGHSTGGTLVLLAAEAAPKGTFRAVIAFGPVEAAAAYGQKNLPFDVRNSMESKLRGPVNYLQDISCPTFVIEGETGNLESLEILKQKNRNNLVSFVPAKGRSHFSVLAPVNRLLAAKILEDTGTECRLQLSAGDVEAL